MFKNWNEKFNINYEEPGDGNGPGAGSGEGSGADDKETIESLKAQIEKIMSETNKEINSLKSQLRHANKTIENYQKNGKTAEELAVLEKEKLEKELAEIKNKYNLITLEAKKNSLITELKISPQFADLVQITPDMTAESLEIAVKNVAAKEKEFTTDFLKKNSITNGGFNPKDKKKDEKDFVDRMIEKNKDNEVDLTKF